MKIITPIPMWENGEIQQATILNVFAENVQLNQSATLCWALYGTFNGNLGSTLSQGNLTMLGDDYQQWDADTFVWDWISEQLNLTILGDYVPPVIEPVVE
jgi:hypothetical protein